MLAGFERHAEDAHDAEGQQRADRERRSASNVFGESPKSAAKTITIDDERIKPRPGESLLHRLESFERAERLAGRFGINRACRLDELLERPNFPKPVVRVCLDEPAAAGADIAVAEGGRQFGQPERLGEDDATQLVQVTE